MTGVAAEPMLRIDDTGLPISTSRARIVPRMGARMVALASSSSARSVAACACATFAAASATRALRDGQLRLRGPLPILRLIQVASVPARDPIAR